ncbi:ABC transporter ATP-binding protein [Parablautia muri]|uniref:ABC transporter ATP-binding protein n=1 Tax=Parablautia muri TaxID=2320879 RepID=A0A9X5GTR5_9FIRM|nr:ABC transporter ATP-binding protein [Parablautia muri]NBJ94060.1 ABC transporter ATP-binding protein [Parablautia muri]
MELKLSNLTKEFKDVAAVDHISYTMTTGVYGLLGVNGAGKTTLMRMLCTLIKPSSGCITWNGKDIFELDGEYRRLLGYLPQDFGYYPDFTVYDYLMYVASIKGLRPATAKQRTARLLKQVGMDKEKKKKMKKLSGGMKRRVGIAQAMLNNPSILILDEPTAGLDPNERIRFRNLIGELAQERLVLLSTHIVSDVAYIAKEILLMKEGKICVAGSLKELLAPMQGQVWSLDVSKEDAETYRKNYKVANVRIIPKGVNLRILSGQRPSENARPESVLLEDVFLHYLGEGMVEEDVSI